MAVRTSVQIRKMSNEEARLYRKGESAGFMK
jgi:hypothetical protein